MTLKDIVLLIMAPGSGGLVYLIMENIAYLKNQPPLQKRIWSLFLSGIIPIMGYLIGVAMVYWNAPADWRAWIEAIAAVVAPAVLTSQTLHGIKQLKKTK